MRWDVSGVSPRRSWGSEGAVHRAATAAVVTQPSDHLHIRNYEPDVVGEKSEDRPARHHPTVPIQRVREWRRRAEEHRPDQRRGAWHKIPWKDIPDPQKQHRRHQPEQANEDDEKHLEQSRHRLRIAQWHRMVVTEEGDHHDD